MAKWPDGSWLGNQEGIADCGFGIWEGIEHGVKRDRRQSAGRKQQAAGSTRAEVRRQTTDDRGQRAASQMVNLSNS